MDSNVAMHDPCPRIVSLKRNYHISTIREQNDIAAWWSFKIQFQALRKFVDIILLKNGEVMTVQVNLMTDER